MSTSRFVQRLYQAMAFFHTLVFRASAWTTLILIAAFMGLRGWVYSQGGPGNTGEDAKFLLASILLMSMFSYMLAVVAKQLAREYSSSLVGGEETHPTRRRIWRSTLSSLPEQIPCLLFALGLIFFAFGPDRAWVEALVSWLITLGLFPALFCSLCWAFPAQARWAGSALARYLDSRLPAWRFLLTGPKRRRQRRP